jgi:hypothetical protein
MDAPRADEPTTRTTRPTADATPEDYLATPAEDVLPAKANGLTGRVTLTDRGSGARHTWVWNAVEGCYLLALIECPPRGLYLPETFWKAGDRLASHLDTLLLEAARRQEPTWRPTAKAEALEPEDFFREDGPFATEAALRAAKARDREAGR